MTKITVEEYIEKYKRYIELLIKKTPGLMNNGVCDYLAFTKILSNEEETEFNTLDKFLSEYHSEFQQWEDFSDRAFLEVYDYYRYNRNPEFFKEQEEFIHLIQNRSHPHFANMFTNW